MDRDKNQLIAQQVERWDVYARLTPTGFLLTSIILIVFEIINFETALYIGLLGFAVTTVTWWWWAIFTIKYLIITLNRATKNLGEVNQEVSDLTKEIKALKNES